MKQFILFRKYLLCMNYTCKIPFFPRLCQRNTVIKGQWCKTKSKNHRKLSKRLLQDWNESVWSQCLRDPDCSHWGCTHLGWRFRLSSVELSFLSLAPVSWETLALEPHRPAGKSGQSMSTLYPSLSSNVYTFVLATSVVIVWVSWAEVGGSICGLCIVWQAYSTSLFANTWRKHVVVQCMAFRVKKI